MLIPIYLSGEMIFTYVNLDYLAKWDAIDGFPVPGGPNKRMELSCLVPFKVILVDLSSIAIILL